MKFLLGELPFIFHFFRPIVGLRLYWVSLVTLAATGTEIIGVSLFLPLLTGGDGDDVISTSIRGAFDYFAISLEFTSVLIVMIGAMILRSVLLFGRDVLMASSSAVITIRLNQRLLRAMNSADFKLMNELRIGRVNNTVAVEIPRVNVAFEQAAGTVAGLAFTVAYFALTIAMSPVLTLVIIGATPVAYFGMTWFNRRIRDISFQTTDAAGAHQHWMLMALQYFRYLRTTGTWELMESRVLDVARTLARIRFRAQVLQAGSNAVFGITALLIVVAVLLHQVNVAGVAVLDAVFMLFLFKRGFDQILVVQATYRKMLTVVGSVHNYADLVDSFESRTTEVRPDGVIPDVAGSLELRNVGVEYRERGKSLSGVNLRVDPGEWIGLVGESGAGKTTALAVLSGLISADSGEAVISGVELRDVDATHFRSRLGYVPQDPAIFDDTFRNNLTLWDEEVAQGTIDEALEIVQLSSMVKDLPNGLDTVLGSNGTAISGGQRQRISIARELIRDVDILILDEATSAIDGPTERLVHEALRKNRDSRSTIVVAHSFETIRECDRIYVLKNGELVETGNFDQLSVAGGEFARLMRGEADGSGAE
jgi:ABC-type multidrug transport system fused ATPase/permease subunit